MPPSSPAPPTLDKPVRPDKRAAPRWWAVLLFAVALGAVVWGSLAPNPPTLQVSQFDKVQHLAAYGLLAGLAYLACRGRSWQATFALLALGVGIEFAQAAGGLGRQGSLLDVAANSGGVLLASLAWPRRR
jgi:VanZ family protein